MQTKGRKIRTRGMGCGSGGAGPMLIRRAAARDPVRSGGGGGALPFLSRSSSSSPTGHASAGSGVEIHMTAVSHKLDSTTQQYMDCFSGYKKGLVLSTRG